MSRNTRDRSEPNTRVVHITNRCWKGLPFVPNRMMRRALNSVLAKAQVEYGIEIVCYLFMGNHYHMILAGNATRVSSFANYVDGEIAKRMMRFFPGWWGPSFWEGRFHEQHLPTVAAVINKIIYVFSNPLKARLVSKLSTYPGASSVKALESFDNCTSSLCPFTFPRFFKPLKSGYISKRKDMELVKEQYLNRCGSLELKTDLFGWSRCFKERSLSKAEILARIKDEIAAAEKVAEKHGVIGAERLQLQALNKEYRPEKKPKAKTPFVDCPDAEVRKYCIAKYRYFRARCREAWNQVKQGLDAAWPWGAFVPPRRWRPLIQPQAG